MMKRFFLLIVLLLTVVVSAAEEIVLIQDGKPDCEIILGDKPVRSAQFAALELQYALNKIAACNVEIRATPSGKHKVLRLSPDCPT